MWNWRRGRQFATLFSSFSLALNNCRIEVEALYLSASLITPFLTGWALAVAGIFITVVRIVLLASHLKYFSPPSLSSHELSPPYYSAARRDSVISGRASYRNPNLAPRFHFFRGCAPGLQPTHVHAQHLVKVWSSVRRIFFHGCHCLHPLCKHLRHLCLG